MSTHMGVSVVVCVCVLTKDTKEQRAECTRHTQQNYIYKWINLMDQAIGLIISAVVFGLLFFSCCDVFSLSRFFRFHFFFLFRWGIRFTNATKHYAPATYTIAVEINKEIASTRTQKTNLQTTSKKRTEIYTEISHKMNRNLATCNHC